MSELIRFRFVRQGFAGARGLAALVLVLALSLAGQGCSDDSTGGVLVDPCLDFTAAAAPASGAVTTRLGDDSTCFEATLEIVATGIDGVWSLDTIVTFDSTLAAYTGYLTTGSVLGSDGAVLTPAIALTDVGELTVGVSRVAPAEAIDIDGTGGVLVKLLFALNSTAADSGPFTLGDECLRTAGEPPPVIPGVNCSGGTLVVRQN